MVGRLGLLMHAAGFHPYGAQPASGHLLTTTAGEAAFSSRRLSRDGAVLLLCDVALLAFLTTERLDVSPLLSRDAEPWASRVCWALAGGVCWGLRVELCRRNGLPLTGLMSLPDDVKAEILRRLDDGKDLANVESTCTQFRQLVAERDAELWKPLHAALAVRRRRCVNTSDVDESEPQEVVSWKRKYVKARWLASWIGIWHRHLFSNSLEDPPEEEEETAVSTTAASPAP